METEALERELIIAVKRTRTHCNHRVGPLAIIAADFDTPIKVQVECNKEIARYIEPQLRSHEITGNEQKPLEIKIND
jgi:hypothetical protein